MGKENNRVSGRGRNDSFRNSNQEAAAITAKDHYPSLQATSKKGARNVKDRSDASGPWRQQGKEELQCNGTAVSGGSFPMPFETSFAHLQVGSTALLDERKAAVADRISMIEKKVEQLRPQRQQLQRCIEAALLELQQQHQLVGCRIEVVGSTSWDGDVPQSDLDLVLVSPTQDAEGPKALELLNCLRSHLELLDQAKRPWTRISLVEARRVPILRIHDRAGNSCDVSIDQMHALEHRSFLLKSLEGRPEVRSFIRLVKYWIRQRSLPMAAEGGIPSLAWALVALRLSADVNGELSVERLLMYFFSYMVMLCDRSLTLRYSSAGSNFVWQPRAGTTPWAEEWIKLISVDDPRNSSNSSDSATTVPGVTPPSIPTAVGALYVAELRMAYKSMMQGKWEDIWKTTTPEVRLALPAVLDLKSRQAPPLHILLKDGVLLVGQLEEVRSCPSMQQEAFLHRRDQSSELLLRPCRLEKAHNSDATSVIFSSGALLSFKPCHWICSLPTWNTNVLQGDGLSRLAELSAMVESSNCSYYSPARRAPELDATRSNQALARHMSMPMGMYPVPIMQHVWAPMNLICGGRGTIAYVPVTSPGVAYVYAHVPRRQVVANDWTTQTMFHQTLPSKADDAWTRSQASSGQRQIQKKRQEPFNPRSSTEVHLKEASRAQHPLPVGRTQESLKEEAHWRSTETNAEQKSYSSFANKKADSEGADGDSAFKAVVPRPEEAEDVDASGDASAEDVVDEADEAEQDVDDVSSAASAACKDATTTSEDTTVNSLSEKGASIDEEGSTRASDSEELDSSSAIAAVTASESPNCTSIEERKSERSMFWVSAASSPSLEQRERLPRGKLLYRPKASRSAPSLGHSVRLWNALNLDVPRHVIDSEEASDRSN